MPLYLSERVTIPLKVVPFDSVEKAIKIEGLFNRPFTEQNRAVLFRVLKCDYIVEADIAKFSVRKRILGDGQLAGMKSYSAECQLKVRIFAQNSNSEINRSDLFAEHKDNNTAINIGRISHDEELYDSLSIVPFGSSPFERTVAGFMMRDLSAKVNAMLLSLPQATVSNSVKTVIKIAKIVDIKDSLFYINAGFGEKITPGELFTVFVYADSLFDPDTKEFLGCSEDILGTIKVVDVKASHFSSAVVYEKKSAIKLFNLVRIER